MPPVVGKWLVSESIARPPWRGGRWPAIHKSGRSEKHVAGPKGPTRSTPWWEFYFFFLFFCLSFFFFCGFEKRILGSLQVRDSPKKRVFRRVSGLETLWSKIPETVQFWESNLRSLWDFCQSRTSCFFWEGKSKALLLTFENIFDQNDQRCSQKWAVRPHFSPFKKKQEVLGLVQNPRECQSFDSLRSQHFDSLEDFGPNLGLLVRGRLTLG